MPPMSGMPPPAAPSYLTYDADPAKARLAGASTVDTTGEYHHFLNGSDARYHHRAYGMGPRVPMYVISPWTKGGWVNSQVHDHTSVIRFIESRFGVEEPLITPWRRAVSGDGSEEAEDELCDGEEEEGDMHAKREVEGKREEEN